MRVVRANRMGSSRQKLCKLWTDATVRDRTNLLTIEGPKDAESGSA